MSPVQSIPPPTVTIATPNSNYNNIKYQISAAASRAPKIMSEALSISNITQKPMSYEARAAAAAAVAATATPLSVEQSAVAAVAAAYQYNYNHLYADRAAAAAAMYAAPPIMFSAPPTHPNLTVAASIPAPIPAHANYKYNGATDSNTVFSAAYFKALQSAVNASIFNSVPPPSPTLTPPTPTVTPTLPKSPNLHMNTGAISPPNNKLPSGGTYLNEKAFNSKPTAVNSENNYFKVPSGKEGSMKHRILTRPQPNPANSQQLVSQEETTQNAIMRTYDTTSNFRKGSYIELANGVLRKVEDMRTEDFIQCAERSPHHKLAESTVVKIDVTTANTVVITFSYDNNCSKADVEVSHDHPFFVYGQGWASYNPEASARVFGLRCQRLQVGDICISLTKRESPIQNEAAASATTTTSMHTKIHTPSSAINMTVSAATPTLQTSDNNTRFNVPTDYTTNVLPLSPHTPPAALVNTSNHLNLPPTLAAAHYAAATHNIPFHHFLGAAAHNYGADMSDLVSAYAYHAPAKLLGSYYPQAANTHVYHHHENQAKEANKLTHSQELIDYKHAYHARYDAHTLPPPPPPPTHIHTTTTSGTTALDTHYPHGMHSVADDEPMDATIARKRRWSAPEGAPDEVEQNRKLSAITHNNRHNGDGGGAYKIFKPAAVVAAATLN